MKKFVTLGSFGRKKKSHGGLIAAAVGIAFVAGIAAGTMKIIGLVMEKGVILEETWVNEEGTLRIQDDTFEWQHDDITESGALSVTLTENCLVEDRCVEYSAELFYQYYTQKWNITVSYEEHGKILCLCRDDGTQYTFTLAN